MANPLKMQRKMATPSLIPQELTMDIFSRLPQKSIGKFKCLSKTWLSLLSTSQFLNLCLTHQGNLILITPSHSLHLLLSSPLTNNDVISRKLDFPGSWTQVVGSCKGLVLLTDKEGELFLINPITSFMSKIPHYDLSLRKDATTDRTHGFGYDACSNDYKIVTLSYYKNMLGITFVDVYSVKTGVWERVDFSPLFPLKPAKGPHVSGVYVNGAIHWEACCRSFSGPHIIAKFDLACEMFYGIDAPKFGAKSLVGRGGRLCMVSSYNNDFHNDDDDGVVWTMEEYGSVKSWRKFTIPRNSLEAKPLCFVGENRVVLRAKDGCLFVYDVENGTMKEFVVDGVHARCVDMGNFVDNLAS